VQRAAQKEPPIAPGTSSWRASPWYTLAVLAAVNVVNWADRQVVPILFPGIRAEIALTDTQLGIIGGLAFSIIYAVTSFGFGWATDHTLRRNVIVVGLIVWSLATAASGIATGFGSLFTARLLTGAGEASLYPAAMSLLAERFPVAGRGRAMGIFGAAAAVGGGLGVGLGGYLAETAGWRNVFFLYGGAGLLLVPLVLSIPEARRDVHDGSPAEPAGRVLGELIRDRRLLMVWTAGLVMMAGAFGYASWVPSFFVRTRGFELAEAGYFFGLAALSGGVVGGILGGTFADRFRRRRLAGELSLSALAAIVSVPLVTLVLVSPSTSVLFTAGLLGPVAIYAFFPPLQTVITELVPQRRLGLAYAVNILFLAGIGQGLGPVAVGRISDASGSLVTGLAATVVAMAVASVLALAAGHVVRRDAR
jgi:predicted MFS family arabinose efflux permease